jgi:hypothetical protein
MALRRSALMGVHLTTQLFVLMMQGSYAFSGKDKDLDLLLLSESRVSGAWTTVLLDGVRRGRRSHVFVEVRRFFPPDRDMRRHRQAQKIQNQSGSWHRRR